MSAIADSTRALRKKVWPRWLVALETLIALNAIGGGIYGLTGAKDVPRAWLDGSPFDSYVIPSLALLILVGGSMLAALGLLVARHRLAPEASIAAGVILLVWLLVEVLIIPFSWLQPAFAVLGVLVVALGAQQRRLRNEHSVSTGASPLS